MLVAIGKPHRMAQACQAGIDGNRLTPRQPSLPSDASSAEGCGSKGRFTKDGVNFDRLRSTDCGIALELRLKLKNAQSAGFAWAYHVCHAGDALQNTDSRRSRI